MKMITLYVNLGDVEKTLWSRGVFRLAFEQTSNVLLRHCEAQNRLIIMMMIFDDDDEGEKEDDDHKIWRISWFPNLSYRSTTFFSVLNSLPRRGHLDDSDDDVDNEDDDDDDDDGYNEVDVDEDDNDENDDVEKGPQLPPQPRPLWWWGGWNEMWKYGTFCRKIVWSRCVS